MARRMFSASLKVTRKILIKKGPVSPRYFLCHLDFSHKAKITYQIHFQLILIAFFFAGQKHKKVIILIVKN
jgi:hypothetical protein